MANRKKTASGTNDSAHVHTPGIGEEFSHIHVRGARVHNLKNISLDIPRDSLVVITGLSGSGKSSLAFDTLYAEGQRRYVESISPYARQYVGLMEKPDVDSIEGLSPAIAIEQKTVGNNPRSTVGTVTEVYDYMRLLWAKVGTQHCTDHPEQPVKNQSEDQIVEYALSEFHGKRLQILAPLVRGRKGYYRDLFEQLRKQGFTRVRVDGELQEIVPEMSLDRYKIHNIDVVIDRLLPDASSEQRLRESLRLAFSKGDDVAVLLGDDDERLVTLKNACPICNKSYPEPAPNSFSFNSPYGACGVCEGLGEYREYVTEMLIPNRAMTISNGAILPLGPWKKNARWNGIAKSLATINVDIDIPLNQFDDDVIRMMLFGTGNKQIQLQHTLKNGRTVQYSSTFGGLIPMLEGELPSSELDAYKQPVPCPSCGGGRLNPAALNVKINHCSISDATALSINEAIRFFTSLKLSSREEKISRLILKEIRERLGFLRDVGLHYLTLNRSARTLSGGEGQRIRLASQIGSQLVGVMYVLDEPSIGLHQHDNRKLIDSLKKLRDLGNTVLVVEHDKEMIEEADHIVDVGPRAGVHGGHIIASDAAGKLLKGKDVPNSLTLDYLSGKRSIEVPKKRRTPSEDRWIVLEGARGHNLKNVTLKIPLGTFCCVTGMSGSGKSTLINDTLYPILAKRFHGAGIGALPHDAISGLEHIDKVIEIDQSPIGQTPRSNPATYTGLFQHIRNLFTKLPESKIRGYSPGRFSFNVSGGRCEECLGAGLKKIEMNFLPDVFVTCDACNGKRYNKETLQIKYRQLSISDVLETTVAEACEVFKDIPAIYKKAKTLNDVGLGYIKLGQQATTLSGGEAQRVKLATELSRPDTKKTLYILDEPTTGLHFEDVAILLKLLHELVDRGNSVLVIEHNLDVIKVADHIIDLGPEGGSGGGEIIATGTPEDVAANKRSLTGKYLKEELYASQKHR